MAAPQVRLVQPASREMDIMSSEGSDNERGDRATASSNGMQVPGIQMPGTVPSVEESPQDRGAVAGKEPVRSQTQEGAAHLSSTWGKSKQGSNANMKKAASESTEVRSTPSSGGLGNTYLDNVLVGEFQNVLDETNTSANEDSDEEDDVPIAPVDNMNSEAKPKNIFTQIVENQFFGGIFMAFTFYALFATDLDMIYGSRRSQQGLQVTTTIVVILFFLEVLIQVFGKKGYFLGAYFWLDLVSLVSLIPDTYFYQIAISNQNLAAGRSTRLTRIIRAASRSSKAARLNRLSRIVRVAALMPRIQRLIGNVVKDDAAGRLLDKKLNRIFMFLDEDMDGFIAQRSAQTCLDKMRLVVGAHRAATWASKVSKTAVNMAARVTDPKKKGIKGGTPTTVVASVKGTAVAPASAASSENEGSPRQVQTPERAGTTALTAVSEAQSTAASVLDVLMDYTGFKSFLLDDEAVGAFLRHSCKRQLKQGNNMQNITARNSEYIGVKVALCVLLLLFVLTFVEATVTDNSGGFGIKSIDGVVSRQYPREAEGGLIPQVIQDQVRIYSHRGYDFGPDRIILYLDLNKVTFCNVMMSPPKPCVIDNSSAAFWGPRRAGLSSLDDFTKNLDNRYRWQDLEWLRYPEFWGQDVTLEQLDAGVTSVALLDKRAENEDDGKRSVILTALVIVIILSGITMLTRDLTFLSKNLLKPLVELADEMESITRLQLAGVSNQSKQELCVVEGTSEVRLIRRTFEDMKKAIKSWGKYVPWPVVQLLLRKDAEASIDVTEREVSIFFSDIASFTTIVESLPPESSLLLLSRYFHDMSKVIDEYGGIVLEFIGDAIMAIYGAPVRNDDHANAAVKAAVKMLNTLIKMNVWLHERKLPEVHIRCGVHTGRVLVGNMGFEQRVKYGVVGEESTFPGRLEESNKNYGTEMLISSSTYARITPDGFLCRPIDYLCLNEVGNGQADLVYQVMDAHPKEPHFQAKKNACKLQTDAMKLYKAKDFNEAMAKFAEAGEQMKEATGQEDGAAALMIKRCTHFLAHPPAHDWDGAFVSGEKGH